MSTNRITQRLNVETSKKAINTDTYLKVNLENSQKLLPLNDINKIIDVSERFDYERQNSTYYRIIGTINSNMTNVLFNLENSANNDLYTWKGFNYHTGNEDQDYRFKSTIYPDNVKNYLKENEGWFGYYDPDITKTSLCLFYDMEPKRERFSFIPDNSPYNNGIGPVKNWELTITYPASIDESHEMVNGGLLIISERPAVVSNREMTALGLACKHNLNRGDIVKITGTNGYNGEYVVIRTGLDNGDLKEYYFVIDKPSSTNSISVNSRMKRKVNGVESEYYFRKFRKIKTQNSPVIEQDDYEIYNLAFSENVFNDKIFQFVFNEDIDVSGLRDNLGRPLSELYLTIIKTDSNQLFGDVSSGIETPYIPELNNSTTSTYLRNIPVINKITNSPFSHYPLENKVTINNNNNIANNIDFYGDLVEFNKNELKEIVLAEVSYRFNTKNRETPTLSFIVNTAENSPNSINLGPRLEGYYYKAHHKIKIREFSNYIEEGTINTYNLPDYAIEISPNQFVWRDLLSIGFNQFNEESLDYPFLNGAHYMYNNYYILLKRQDPFNNWNLYYNDYPADPIGQRMTTNFDTNFSENVCD